MATVRERLDQLNELEDSGHYERALLLLRSLPEDVRKRPDVLRRMGVLLRRLGRYGEALGVLKMAGEDEKTRGLLRECLEDHVQFLETLGCHQAAAQAREMLLSEAPDDVRTMINQGISYAMADDYERALECFDRALAADPENEKAWYNKGAALLDVGYAKRAVECFDRTIGLNPSNAVAWHQKAVCLLRLAEESSLPRKRMPHVEEARQCLGKALRIDPRLEEARDLLNKIQGG